MFVLSAMSYFDRTIMSIVAPLVIRDFGISETQMGAVFSAFIISYAVFQAPGGRLADRFGPRLVLTFAGLGAALFTGLTAFGGKPGLGSLIGIVPSFLVVRLAFGTCTAPLYPGCGKMVAAWFPERSHARLQALIISGAPVGSAVSPVLFSRLIGSYGWRRSFWGAAGATAVAVMLWFGFARDRPSRGVQGATPVRVRAPVASWRELLTDRTLLLLTTGYFCLSYFESIFFYWIYYYFGEIRQIGAARSATYVTILFLAMAIMLPLGGWASDRLVLRHGRKVGRRTVPLISMTLSAVLLYAGVSGVGTFATVSFLSLALGLAASSEGAFWGSAIDIGGKRVGAVCGILNTGGNFGAILGPIVTPFIANRLGWTWGLYFGSIIVFVGVLVWFFIDPTRTISRNSRLSSVLNQR
jgi:ACS family glucarate transporter-like MFS transporter